MTDLSNSQQSSDSAQKTVFNLPSKPFFRVSDALTGGLLAVNWIYPLYHLRNLSETIPMQYSITGAINWSASKHLIFLLPISATIAYVSYLYRKAKPEQLLFPLKAPQGKPEKVSVLATTLKKALGVFTQAAVLAGSVLLVKGPLVSQATRGKWIQAGLVSSGFTLVLLYSGIHYLLNKN